MIELLVYCIPDLNKVDGNVKIAVLKRKGNFGDGKTYSHYDYNHMSGNEKNAIDEKFSKLLTNPGGEVELQAEIDLVTIPSDEAKAAALNLGSGQATANPSESQSAGNDAAQVPAVDKSAADVISEAVKSDESYTDGNTAGGNASGDAVESGSAPSATVVSESSGEIVDAEKIESENDGNK